MKQLAVAKSLTPEQIAELLKVKESYQQLSEKYHLSETKYQDIEFKYQELQSKYQESEAQLKWFKSQTFGKKSEIRKPLINSRQQFLGESLISEEQDKSEEAKTETISYQRKKRSKKTKIPNQVSDIGLQFDDSVEVKEIITENPLIKDLDPSEYEVIGEHVSYSLAQIPAVYKVLKCVQKVVKLNGKISSNPKPQLVLEGTYADVSLLANLAIDKCLYHLPIYRQEQRILASGIKISRNTLIGYVQRTAELLEPIYNQLLTSIRSGTVVWMDETPIKAGKSKGKMKSGWFWSLYGKSDEVAFWYDPRRSSDVVYDILPNFQGTLQTDDHGAYSKYVTEINKIEAQLEHALCWSHTRRKFIKAEEQEQELVEQALSYIRELYQIEKLINNPDKTQKIRGEQSKLVVDKFFNFLKDTFSQKALLPSSLFTQAVNYTLDNEKELRVFLANPEVTLDTNHLERQIRPVAIGRKNWLFCDSEAGAKNLAILYSLIQSCRLQNINPYDYLVDVLQRILITKNKDINDLIPRNWKLKFKKEDWLTSLVNQ